jgi:acyl carrier protein
MPLTQQVLQVLDGALSLQGRAFAYQRETPLLGAVPELDSMGVLAVITGLENHFGIAFSDDDLNAAVFATVGSVCDEVQNAMDRMSP